MSAVNIIVINQSSANWSAIFIRVFKHKQGSANQKFYIYLCGVNKSFNERE